jgi:hypothetical protein
MARMTAHGDRIPEPDIADDEIRRYAFVLNTAALALSVMIAADTVNL